MAAYLVYICQSVKDRKELEIYWRDSPATLEGHEIKLLSVYTPVERLEGEGRAEGVVLAEFPSVEAARVKKYSTNDRAVLLENSLTSLGGSVQSPPGGSGRMANE